MESRLYWWITRVMRQVPSALPCLPCLISHQQVPLPSMFDSHTISSLLSPYSCQISFNILDHAKHPTSFPAPVFSPQFLYLCLVVFLCLFLFLLLCKFFGVLIHFNYVSALSTVCACDSTKFTVPFLSSGNILTQ